MIFLQESSEQFLKASNHSAAQSAGIKPKAVLRVGPRRWQARNGFAQYVDVFLCKLAHDLIGATAGHGWPRLGSGRGGI